MNFGDWEIFKAAVTALRESEATTNLSGASGTPTVDLPKQEDASAPSEAQQAIKPNIVQKQVRMECMPENNKNAILLYITQITMEDQMITGALELLNDEAKEDARKGNKFIKRENARADTGTMCRPRKSLTEVHGYSSHSFSFIAFRRFFTIPSEISDVCR